MEAVAKHQFVATQEDEMSFDKGSTVNVLDMDADKNWFKAEQHEREGWIPRTYIEMKPHNWFHGKITRHQAETTLSQQNTEGAFLVRESESSPGDFSMSVCSRGQTQHFKIFKDREHKYHLWSQKFNSLNQLVDFHRNNSVSKTQEIFLKDTSGTMTQVQALFDFEAQEEGELSFSKGDWIVVVDSSEKDWWRGKAHGVCGLFPSNYVSFGPK